MMFISEDPKSTWVRAPHSLKVAKKVLRIHILSELQRNLKIISEVLGILHYSTIRGSGACQTSRPLDSLCSKDLYGIRNEAFPIPDVM